MPVQKTANIGLQLPYSADHVDLNVFNSNSTIIDTSVGGIQNGIAIIANGNTHPAIPGSNWSIYVKNHPSIPEGMYRSLGPISENTPLSIPPGPYNIVAEANGALNRLADTDMILSSRAAGVEQGLVEIYGLRSDAQYHVAISKGTFFGLRIISDPDNPRTDVFYMCRATRDIAANEPFDDPELGTGNVELAGNILNALNSNLNNLIKVIKKQDKIPNGVSGGDHGYIAVSFDVPSGYKTSGIVSIGHGYPGIGNPLSFNCGVDKGLTGDSNVAYVAYYANGGVAEQYTAFILHIQCIKSTSNIDVS